MPQIGWFEILIIVVLAILIIGPKDFPIMLKKVGGWLGSLKKYINDIKADVSELETTVEDEISLEKDFLEKTKTKNNNE